MFELNNLFEYFNQWLFVFVNWDRLQLAHDPRDDKIGSDNGWIDGWMGARMDGLMDGWMDGHGILSVQ